MSWLASSIQPLLLTLSTLFLDLAFAVTLLVFGPPESTLIAKSSRRQPKTSPVPIASVTPAPTPAPSPKPQRTPKAATPPPAAANYELQPDPEGREGFYIMSAGPQETMASVSELNQAVNTYRQTHNLNQLSIDPQLCQVADQRAIEIESNFSHSGFEEHVNNGDYNYTGFRTIGENLWQGDFSAVHIVEYGWDKSPGHRANLQGNWNRGCAGINGSNAVFVFVN